MNSKLRFYLRGLGIGILVTAVIFIAVNLSRNNGEMTDAEIKKRAAELGMVEANSYSLIDATQGIPDEQDVDNTGADNGKDSGNTSNDPIEIDPVNNDDRTGNEEPGKDSNGSAGIVTGDNTDSGDEADNKDDAGKTDESGDADDDAAADNADKSDDAAADNADKSDDAAAGDADKTEGADKENAEDKVADSDNSGKTEETEKTEDTGLAAGTEVTITIASGSASETAATILKNAGLIDDATKFNTYMIQNGYDRRIHPGTFTIKAGSTYEEICKIIAG